MKNDVQSKISTLREVLDIAESKLSRDEISIDQASKANEIISVYLSHLEKEVLN